MTHEFASFLKELYWYASYKLQAVGNVPGVDGGLPERQYRNHSGGRLEWESLSHTEGRLLFEKNMWAWMKCTFRAANFYTIFINKGKTGCPGNDIAIVKGMDARAVTSVLLRSSDADGFR